jgi:hypothetical protein
MVEFPSLETNFETVVLVGITHVAPHVASPSRVCLRYDAITLATINKKGRCRFAGTRVTLVATSTWEAEYVMKQWKQSGCAKTNAATSQNRGEGSESRKSAFSLQLSNTLSSLKSPNRQKKFLDE